MKRVLEPILFILISVFLVNISVANYSAYTNHDEVKLAINNLKTQLEQIESIEHLLNDKKEVEYLRYRINRLYTSHNNNNNNNNNNGMTAGPGIPSTVINHYIKEDCCIT